MVVPTLLRWALDGRCQEQPLLQKLPTGRHADARNGSLRAAKSPSRTASG